MHERTLMCSLVALAMSPLALTAQTAQAAPLGITKAAVEQPAPLVELARVGGGGVAARGGGARAGAAVRRGGAVGARGVAVRRAGVVGRPGLAAAGIAGAGLAGAGVVGAGLAQPGWRSTVGAGFAQPGWSAVAGAGVARPDWAWRGGRWIRPAGFWWQPGGAIAAGAALGVIAAADAAAFGGVAPGSNMCWHYTDYWNQGQGFWDTCP